MIIDFHAHILPGMDDGSRDRDMTEQMLKAAEKQHIDAIVATPHFYADSMALDPFVKKRDQLALEAGEMASRHGISLTAGAEVAFFSGISRAEQCDQLCIGQTGIMMLEMPFRPWDSTDLHELDGLLRRGFQVILAHVERFLPFQNDRRVLHELLNMPVYLQVNAESLMSRVARRRSFRLFERGDVLLGSDCHNLTGRPVNLQAGRAALEKKYGTDMILQMDRLGEQLLEGRFES